MADTNNFDNGFEKLDPFAPSGNEGEGSFVSSTTRDDPEVDMYSGGPTADAGASPLLDFGGEAEAKPTPPAAEPTPSKPETLKPQSASSDYPFEFDISFHIPASWLKNIDPRVLDLIYWRDPKKTGVVFGSMMVLLLSLALFSVLSVVAYLSLAALTVTVSFRVYKQVLGAVQKTGEGHPFKDYLDVEIALPEDKLHELADIVMKNVTCTMKELRRLFLVQDMVDSLKFGLLLWALTYVGAWFNGMTLLILATVGIFTIPKVYETNKTQIDQYLDLACTQVKNVMNQIKEKIPLPGKKKQS